MTITVRAAARSAQVQALVTDLGASATLLLYNGTKPASMGAVTGGNTLPATLTFGSDVTQANGGSAGGVANGTLTFGGFTQTASSHVSGTPTFGRFCKSDGTVVLDVDVGSGNLNLGFTGSVVQNQDILGTVAISDGNA